MRDLMRLVRLWRGSLPLLIGALAISLFTTFANLALMATAGWFVTAMAVAGAAGVTMNYFTPSAIIRFAAIVRTGGRWLDRVVSHEATFALLASTRVALFARLAAIAPGGLADLRSGEVAARLKLDIDRLEIVFLRLVAPVVVAIVVGAVVIRVVAWFGQTSLAWLLAAILVVGGLIGPALVVRAARTVSDRDAVLAATLRRRTTEHLDGLATLLVTGDDRRRIDALDELLAQRIEAERRIATCSAFGAAGLGAASDVAVIAVLGLGVSALGSAAISGPDLTLILLLVLASFEAFAPLPVAAAGLGATLVSLQRLFALWDRAALVEEPAHPLRLPQGFDLVVDRVSLTYPGRTMPALRDVDFSLPQGAERRLDGPSGSGKSTLIDLLLRVRDPDAGEIRLGGVPVRRLALADLRSAIALVPQQPHIFAATIADNLRAFAPEASDAELWAALEGAGLKQAVTQMPAQLATYVGEGGTRLSGGEVRRLAIARGLLRTGARILILDEPTEGLDDATAAEVMRGVERLRRDRSLLIVSHRA
ncbi:thiol reductant ABC exporter subunit CydC [Rhodopseudomonas sp. B29]|uniref:thiol reductant ABC exporter subunit CydC n=1 Tax=Rhodopseudomonas sp. B29 TaxID=95607 RepID=UPI0003495234|nr:thiol reductant ABC exporter subunit CydC [Rhodopseudomonas sp. B29]